MRVILLREKIHNRELAIFIGEVDRSAVAGYLVVGVRCLPKNCVVKLFARTPVAYNENSCSVVLLHNVVDAVEHAVAHRRLGLSAKLAKVVSKRCLGHYGNSFCLVIAKEPFAKRLFDFGCKIGRDKL